MHGRGEGREGGKREGGRRGMCTVSNDKLWLCGLGKRDAEKRVSSKGEGGMEVHLNEEFIFLSTPYCLPEVISVYSPRL